MEEQVLEVGEASVPLATVAKVRVFTTGLRALADWYDGHPGLPLPYTVVDAMRIFCVSGGTGMTGRTPLETLSEIARAMGTCEKFADATFYRVRKDFGGGVKLEALAYHKEVCTAKETTKVVKKLVGTKFEKVEEIKPVEFEELEVVETVVEWVCPESLLALGREVAAAIAMVKGEGTNAHPAS